MADAQHVPAPPPQSLPARRPAETATAVAAALVGLGAKVWGWDGETVGYLTILVGSVPAGVTALVEWRRSVRRAWDQPPPLP